MWQVGAACYSTPEAAAAASASLVAGSITGGADPSIVSVGAVTASSITYEFQPLSGAAPYTVAVPYNPQPCGLLQWEDGIELGWAVVAVWATAYGIRFLANHLNKEAEAINGNA